MFNKIFLLGNLGADPELKTGKSGKSYCRFSIATTSVVGGEKKTEWFRCTAFGRTGDALAKYCSKGQTVFVEGRVEEQKYTDKNGNPRSNSMGIALSVQFLAKNTAPQKKSFQGSKPNYQQDSTSVDEWDEEVPF